MYVVSLGKKMPVHNVKLVVKRNNKTKRSVRMWKAKVKGVDHDVYQIAGNGGVLKN